MEGEEGPHSIVPQEQELNGKRAVSRPSQGRVSVTSAWLLGLGRPCCRPSRNGRTHSYHGSAAVFLSVGDGAVGFGVGPWR